VDRPHESGWHLDVGIQRLRAIRHPTHPNRRPRRRRMTSQRNEPPTPLTPLAAQQTTPRTPPASARNAQPDAPPKRSQHQRPPPDRRPTTSVSGGPPPVLTAGVTDARRVVGAVDPATRVQRLQQLCAIHQCHPPRRLGSAYNPINHPRAALTAGGMTQGDTDSMSTPQRTHARTMLVVDRATADVLRVEAKKVAIFEPGSAGPNRCTSTRVAGAVRASRWPAGSRRRDRASRRSRSMRLGRARSGSDQPGPSPLVLGRS
jgi:hypothetical protein